MARFDEYTDTLKDLPDFTTRQRQGSLIVIGGLFVIALIVLIYGAVNPKAYGSESVFISLVTLLFGALSGFALYSLQRTNDLLTEVEFQNTLFASATSKHHNFTLILRADGSFAYTDSGFARMFPVLAERGGRSLDELMDAAGLAHSDASRVYEAMEHARTDHFLFSLADDKGHVTPMRLSVYPLERPKGFFLIQGREFVARHGSDTGLAVAPSGMPSPAHVQHLLEGVPVGLYVTSPSGRLRIVSHLLESMLGYGAGDMLRRELALRDLLYREEEKVGFGTEDYDGEILLAHKNGSLIRARLTQRAQRDEGRSLVATVGMVEPLAS